MKKIAIVADPLSEFKIYKDSTYGMMAEAARRGIALYACLQGDLAALDTPKGNRVVGRFAPIHLNKAAAGASNNSATAWFEAGEAQTMALHEFDAVLMRKDPPFDMEYVYSTYLLERAQEQGARVFNYPRAVRDHSEKLAILEFPQFTAPTIVTRQAGDLRAFVREHKIAVFKLLDGMGGTMIYQARHDDPNLSVIIETMNQFGARSVMAQRYLPQIVEGDKRILLIGGEVVPYALARVPLAGESRGNLAAGGRGEARALSPRDREIAEYLAPVLAKRGLLLVGLDVIGDCLTEINVTSPTCFQEITQQTDFNVAKLFIDRLEKACQ
jgi:glutathione synthase